METDSKRDQYIKTLEQKLQKAGKARRFLDDADGSIVTEWATTQINAIMKGIGGQKYIDDHNGYVRATGELAAYQKLLNMLNSEANTDTEQVKGNLEAARTDG